MVIIMNQGQNNENYQDDCHLISQISQEEVDFLIQKWKNDGIPQL
jgi:hypothetical protein